MKFLNFSNFKSLFSILTINLKIIFFKLRGKKILFFYSPSQKLNKVAGHIEYLFQNFEENFIIIFGLNSKKIFKKNNHYFVKPFFLRGIFNVDIFLDNTCVKYFTNKSTRILISHDLYYTPLPDIDKEKSIMQRMVNYDYIFLSNKKNIEALNFFFNKYNLTNKFKLPKLIETGYIKLDFIKQNMIKTFPDSNKIIIAPTNQNTFNELSLLSNLDQIIEILLLNTNSEIILRPHPANRENEIILNLKKKYFENSKFIYDISNNYFDTYSNSTSLITDISGTAYTYAFFTKKPVIFYSVDEKLVKKIDYEKVSFFKDRNKIGVIVENINELEKTIMNIISIQKEKKKSIDLLEKEMIFLGNSKNQVKKIINQIVKI